MRVERLELDGFGHFAGAAWDLPPGLSVILGDNEAGKTTLLSAIRALLFGFEPTRRDRAWYPAVAGGRRGGRMLVEIGRGDRWTIQRHGERGGPGSIEVRAPNGNRGGQETLDRLLGGASRDLFNNIFAFGIGELQDFGSLSGEGVRSRIYGAGTGLGGTSVVDVERGLRQAQDEVFRARGQKGINELLAAIEERRAKIAQLEQMPAEYESAHRRLAELGEALRRAHSERLRLLEETARLTKLEQARPIFSELDGVERELGTTDPRDDGFPDDALARLERLQAAVEQAARRVDDADAAIGTLRRRLDGLPIDEHLLEHAGEIRALRDEAQLRDRRAGDIAQAAALAQRHAAEVEEHLRRLGPGWDEARLMAVDDSIAAVQALVEIEAEMGSARGAVEAARAQLHAIDGEIASHAAPDAGDRPMAAAEISARVAALRALGDARGELRVLDERQRALDARRDELGARATDASPGGRGPSAQRVLAPAAASGPALLALVLGILLGGALGAPLVGGALGAVAGAFAGYLTWRWLGSVGGGATGDGDAASRARRLADLEASGSALDAERRSLAARLEELASAAGLDGDPTGAAVLEEELAQRRGELAERQANERRLVALHEARTRRAADVQSAERRLDHVRGRWTAWLEARGLPAGLSPEAARQVLATAGAARRAAGHRDDARAVARRDADDRARFDDRLAALLRALDVRDASTAPSRGGLAALAAQLDRSVENRSLRDEVAATLAEREERRAALILERDAVAGQLDEWLHAHGAADADDMASRAGRAARRRSLLNRCAEAREKLTVLLGASGVDEARRSAAGADPAALEAARIAATRRVEELDDEIATAQGERGALRDTIKRLEAADELGGLRQEVASLQAAVEDEAHRWTVRAIALRLLEETRRSYERERQPQVIRDAERYFASITGERYGRIISPPGETSVRVEEAGAGRDKELDELSRGTAEQLYLALRFGLIEEFARNAEPLPVVMDDILVNFDAGRAARAAEAIRLLARSHQVLYFTCHRPTAEMLDPSGERTRVLG